MTTTTLFTFNGQGRRKHLKLGGHDTSKALFLKKKGHFLTKRALLCLLQNLGGTCPQCPPVPTAMVDYKGTFSLSKAITSAI